METGQLPTTHMPVSSSSATIATKLSAHLDNATATKLQHIEASLSSSDWSDRMTGIQKLHKLVASQPTAVAGQLTKVCLLTVKCHTIDIVFYLFDFMQDGNATVIHSSVLVMCTVCIASFNCLNILIITVCELL